MPNDHHNPAARCTLKNSATLTGRGLFTGVPVSITLAPPPKDAPHAFGFRFADHNSPKLSIPISPAALTQAVPHPAFAALAPRNTSIDLPLIDSTTRPLFTIEHLLSALVGCGVHDCLLLSQGPEIPILDGSALDFVNAIHAAGTVPSATPPNPITIADPITVTDERGGSVTIEPLHTNQPTYSYHLDYGPDSPIPPSTATWNSDPKQYLTDISPARTFCLEHEAKQMHALGLFKNLTERDMLVIAPATNDRPAGPIDNSYRLNNEPAKHKLLDLIGDLALIGSPLMANITATKSGHALHHRAAQAVLDSFGS